MQPKTREDQHLTRGDNMVKRAATNIETEADSAWATTKETETKEYTRFESGFWLYQETNTSYQVKSLLPQVLFISLLCLYA